MPSHLAEAISHHGSSIAAAWARVGRRIVDQSRRFQADTSGVVAIIVALSSIPIVGIAGAGLDYSRAQNIRSAYQDAADAAAMAVATSTLSSPEARQAFARAVFAANAPAGGHELGLVQLLEVDLGHEVRANGTVDTSLLSILGIDDIAVGVRAVAVASSQPLEISFVIDSTQSMTFGNRWQVAHASLEAMLTSLDEAIDRRGNLHVTAVPMGDRVNVGVGRFEWVEGFAEDRADEDDDDDNNRGRRGHWNDEERERDGDQGRRGWRDDDDDDHDALPMAQWTGCVEPREEEDRGNPYHLDDATPDEVAFAPLDHRTQGGEHRQLWYQCPSPIVGPTVSINDVINAMRHLTPAGTGRFDEGLAWGWRTVSSNWSGEWGVANYPARSGDARKVVVFISDGNSTMEDYEFDGHSEWGYNNSGAAMFDNLAAVCTDMKAQGITLYMLYIEGNPYADDYFRECASSPAHYFDVTTNEAMAAAFDAMGTSLMQARLVR